MTDLPIDKSHFIGLVIGLILFGIYTCLFAVFLWWANHEKSRPHPRVMSTLVLLYVISTAVVVCWIIDNTFAFIRDRETIGPIEYFVSPNDVFNPIKVMFNVIATFMADCLFAWRLYIIFDRRKSLLLFTVPLFVIGGAAGIVLVAYGFKAARGDDHRYDHMKNIFAITAMGTTVLFNVLVTSLIAGRLWFLSRQVAYANSTPDKFYKRVAGVIVDSGVIYTATMMTFIILAGIGMDGAQNLVYYLVPMVVGMVPTLMVVRLNLAQTSNAFNPPTSSDRTAVSTLRFLPNPNLASQYDTMDLPGSVTASAIGPGERPKLGSRQGTEASVKKVDDVVVLEDARQSAEKRRSEGARVSWSGS